MEDEIIEEYMTEKEIEKGLGYGYPEPEEKNNMIAFFKDIIRSKFNAKTGYLKEEELGVSRHPVRTLMKVSNFCNIMDMSPIGKYFEQKAQIILATSLSREGFLDVLSVTSKKLSTTELKKMGVAAKKRTGFFAKKEGG